MMTAPLTDPVLVLLDHSADGALRPPVLELLTAARALAPDAVVHGIWTYGALDTALPALAEQGVAVVHRVDLGGADPHATPVVAEALAAVVGATGASLVLGISTFENKEIAARMGVTTGAGVVVDAGDVQLLDGRVVAGKTVFAGTWNTRCAITVPLAVVLLKANSVQAEPASVASSPAVVDHAVDISARSQLQTVEEHTERAPSGRPDLSGAQIVVAGGRGTNGDFSVLDELADLLGGAVGGTRVATDEGWIDYDAQIGQTGVTVAPKLYIGAGVSGAVHHRGGMQASGTIVAVNSDPEAPIFEIADFGVVGDLFTVLPQAMEELRRLRG
jgi:electron transfer flavoprotein alpha subunit